MIEDRLITKDEVCEFLKISKSKIDIMMKENSIPYYKIGKNVRFDFDDLKNWLVEKRRM
jgi:excisionase family DNA binding protein